jgi:nitroreductase
MLLLIGCNTPSSNDTNMKTIDPIESMMTRVSVRQFTGDSISQQQLDTLLHCAMAAPSAMNSQPWAFIVVTDRAVLDQIGAQLPYSRCANNPACAIIPCGDLTKAIEGEGQNFWINDVSAATENLLLAAHAMGLGAVWTGIHPGQERINILKEILALPEHIIPLCVVPVGVPAEQPEVKNKYKEENIHYNKW